MFTGSIGANYHVSDQLAIVANIGRGFRAPELFELFVNGVHGGVAAFQRGDPTLDEETSLNTDIGIRWRSERLQFKANIYRNAIEDYIFPVWHGGNQRRRIAYLPGRSGRRASYRR